MCFFFQAEDGIRVLVRSRGLGDVYKRQVAFSFGNDSLHIVTAESHWSTAELVTLSTTDWSPIQRRQLSTEGTVARLYPHFSLLIDFDPFFVGGPPRARLINLQTGELIREVPQGSRRCAMALDTSGSPVSYTHLTLPTIYSV